MTNARSHRNDYLAESQMTRAIWNLLWDKKEFGSNRTLGFESELGNEEEEQETERFLADGSAHYYETDSNKISLIIDDANQVLILAAISAPRKFSALKPA